MSEGRLGRDGLWDPLEMWVVGWERRLQLVFHCKDRKETGHWIWRGSGEGLQ